jgi:hypothetical protein
MKLRILGDSLRLRLARSEVDAIARGEPVTGSTTFPGGARLVYALSTGDVRAVSAHFANGRIDVLLPRAAAVAWARGNDVAIRGSQPTSEGALALLIEKDFACLQPRDGEDAADRYPNPKASQRGQTPP